MATMTIDQKMIKEYGSRVKALQACIALKMSNQEIANHYGCSYNFIRKKMMESGLTNEVDGRKKVKVEDDDFKGMTSVKQRREMTEKMLSGEELSRARLDAQVTIYRRGDRGFEEVARDVMIQRTKSITRAFTEKYYRE